MHLSTELTLPVQVSRFQDSVAGNSEIINLDGDLKAPISAESRDLIWKGKKAWESDWFAGDPGRSRMKMYFDYSNPGEPVAICDIQFDHAWGNRPFAFMSTINGAFPKLYLREIRNIIVHFDIKFEDFSTDRRGWLRTAVVVGLQSDTDGERIFFEQDIQDSPRARAALPLEGGRVSEKFYADIDRERWVHLDVPFGEFMQSRSSAAFAKRFFDSPNSTFLESVYLVNESFGNGAVKYRLTNFWVSVEKVDGSFFGLPR